MKSIFIICLIALLGRTAFSQSLPKYSCTIQSRGVFENGKILYSTLATGDLQVTRGTPEVLRAYAGRLPEDDLKITSLDVSVWAFADETASRVGIQLSSIGKSNLIVTPLTSARAYFDIYSRTLEIVIYPLRTADFELQATCKRL